LVCPNWPKKITSRKQKKKSRTLTLEYLKRFWTGLFIVLFLELNIESFFFDLLASVGSGNEVGLKAYVSEEIHKRYFIFSSFELLADQPRDFSQAEKKIKVAKANQIHKLTTTFIQKGQKLSFWVKIVAILWICSAVTTAISFSAWDKSRDSSANSSKFEHMEWVLLS
jgi:hypothetical protein